MSIDFDIEQIHRDGMNVAPLSFELAQIERSRLEALWNVLRHDRRVGTGVHNTVEWTELRALAAISKNNRKDGHRRRVVGTVAGAHDDCFRCREPTTLKVWVGSAVTGAMSTGSSP